MATKQRGRLSLLGEVVLQDLKAEARYESALARFMPDDDTTKVPEVDPLSSAQAKLAQRSEVMA